MDQRPLDQKLFDLSIMAAALQKALEKKAADAAQPQPPTPTGLYSTTDRR